MSKARTRLPFEYPVEAHTGLEAHIRSHAVTSHLPSGCRDSARREAKFPAPRLRRPARNRACGGAVDQQLAAMTLDVAGELVHCNFLATAAIYIGMQKIASLASSKKES